MSFPAAGDGEQARLDIDRAVDRLADEFEAAWKSGSHPGMDDYLRRLPDPARLQLFDELLAIELEYRADRMDPGSKDEYLARYPQYAARVHRRFDTAASDSQVRIHSGTPDSTSPFSSTSITPATPPSATGTSDAENTPQKLGRYIIKKRLGSGAMGVVYLAYDPHLDRNLAVKVLPAEFSKTPERLQRFNREARLLARVQHSNIVTVYDVGVEGDRAFIAMELVDGGSLDRAVTPERPMHWREATRAIRDAAAGLAAAHRVGLVHRDVKPANLMRTSTGLTKVGDFGLARPQIANTQLTEPGIPVGTPAFMAPEQWGGEDVDARSDLYSLICTYYYLLTGQLPFCARSALGFQHRHELFSDARRLVPEIPDAVCRVLTHGSQESPSQRFQQAEELAAELDSLLTLSEVPPSAVSQLGEGISPEAVSSSPILVPTSSLPGPTQVVDHPKGTQPFSLLARLNRPLLAFGTVACLLLGTIIYVSTNTGSVKFIFSDPKAKVEVQVDGSPVELTSFDEALRFPTGHHDLSATSPGMETVTRSFRVYRGETTIVEIKLVARPLVASKTATFTIQIDPPEARLVAKGQGVTVTGSGSERRVNVAQPDPRRPVTLVASLSGFEELRKDLEPSLGPATTVSLKLRRAPLKPTAERFPQEMRIGGDRSVSPGSQFSGKDKVLGRFAPKTTTLYEQDFESGNADATTVYYGGFAISPGLRGSAHSFVSQNQSESGQIFGIDGVRSDDVRIEADFEIRDAAVGDFELGFNVLAVTEPNYRSPTGYWLTLHPRRSDSTDNLLKMAFVNGEVVGKSLGSKPGCIGANEVHHLAIERVGDSVASYLDGKAFISTDDGTYHGGGIYFRFFGPGAVDNIRVTSLPSVRPSSIVPQTSKEITWRESFTLAGGESVNFSPDGRQLVVGTHWMYMSLWDTQTGGLIQKIRTRLPDHPATEVGSPCFSPDGTKIAAAIVRFNQVDLWDAKTYTKVASLSGHSGQVGHVAFSPDGKLLISGSGDGTARIWNVETGKQTGMLQLQPAGDVSTVSFSPDQKRVVTAKESSPEINIWDVEARKECLTLKGHAGGVLFACFSPDGRRLASAGKDGVVRMWNAQTGDEDGCLKGHSGAVCGLAFGPNGKLLVSVGEDRSVRVWDAVAAEQLQLLSGHTDTVFGVALDRNGRMLATSSRKEAKIWHAVVEGDRSRVSLP